MEDLGASDPFLWDVEVVVQNLCIPGCAWTREEAILAGKVREEEFDGKTLLTFEHMCSQKELMECLGIKLARHRVAMAEAIFNLRCKSPGYQAWLRDYIQKQDGLLGDVHIAANNFQAIPPLTDGTRTAASMQATRISPSTGPSQEKGIVENGVAHRPEPPTFLPSLPILLLDQAMEGIIQNGSVEAASSALPSPQVLPNDQPLPSTKELHIDNMEGVPPMRKRIAPFNVTDKPLHASAIPIPTEADNAIGYGFMQTDEARGDFPWESSSTKAYLGSGSLSVTAMKSPSGSISSHVIEIDKDRFTIGTTKVLPLGRRLVVYRATKQLFRENSRKEALLNQGMRVHSVTPSDDGDPVLSLSDLPDTFDDQTLREIEAEEMELQRFEQLQAQRYLSRDRVREIIDEAVAGFSMAWEDSKLPKYQRRAWKIWHVALRGGTRKIQILKARQEAKLYDDRIKKLYAGIMDEKWSKETEVRLQARSLEQTVEDKLYRLWLISLLETRAEPPRPSSVPQITGPAIPRPSSPLSGEELFSSDNEDDFIIPDEPSGDYMVIDSVDDEDFDVNHDQSHMSPMKSEASHHVDLTQRTPVKVSVSQSGRIEIDLTTPDRISFALDSSQVENPNHRGGIYDNFPPAESFGAMKAIGEQSAAHWGKEGKRWHLILCMLWKLRHDRRMAILRLVQDNAVSDIWDATIKRHLREPLTDPSQAEAQPALRMAFDLTRLFLSFIRSRPCKEHRITELSDKHKREIEKHRNQIFPRFCEFLAGMAEHFPQEDQIYRKENLENDLLDQEDMGDEAATGNQDTPSKARKNQNKEIILNKEAMDFREREKRRAEEQKARQATLRAKLSITNSLSRDKSRLIINETKEEDQALIYVNEEIGKRIKDHQIDGVRFLWNQVVLDPESRQGCLLAHTMGLGKTMQVITLLVAIAEAALSPDPSTQAQIPEYLRESKTLVLCPAGLVDNWMDELLLWAPAGLLGSLRKIDSTMENSERFSAIKEWAQRGGVLVIGYTLFRLILTTDEEIQSVLTDAPNIVVADEAHCLKSPDAKISRACSQFRTMSRIALTGSPLANNVEEYHSMIDWVAPNYLGPLSEFRDIYATPIQQGLWGDSLGSEKREALKMLRVLKETVAPKVHRATIKSCLKNDLPPKFEFVITVAATEMQKRLYELYIGEVAKRPDKIPQAQLFGIVNDLTLICNHPRCFKQKVIDNRKTKDPTKESTTNFLADAAPAFLKETNIADLDAASLSAKVELLIKILDEARSVGDKVLVFSQSIPTIDFLTYILKSQQRRVQRLDGNTAIKLRQDMIKDFNTGVQDVYIISTKAGGVGLNIQGANRVVIFDFKWNPVSDQQAIGRAYRIGQQKTVFVYRFIVAGSFEEDLQNKAVFKMQLASRVVDKKNPISWSKRLGGLLHPITQKPPEDLSPFAGKDRILDALIGYKNPEVILSIVSTDTFEEEDLSIDLTTEESKQAESLINLNRLRITDPQEYKRLKEHEQREEMARVNFSIPHLASQPLPNTVGPMPVSERTVPSSEPPRPHQGLDGAYDMPDTPRASLTEQLEAAGLASWRPIADGGIEAAAVHQTVPAPLPIVGANTFFRQQPQLQPQTQPNVLSQPEQGERNKPLPATGSIFSNPQSQARLEFERNLSAILHTLRETIASGALDSCDGFAHTLTLSIERIRKDRAFGFLPDNQQWKLLTEFLSNDRLVRKMVIGQVTPGFLALASRAELERRIETFNGISEEEFQMQLERGLRQPEPHNLQNIRRSSQRSPEIGRGKRAQEDLKVMREAADNRRLRSVRRPLPPWANDALSGGNARSSPSRGTEEPSNNVH